jgi:hypothetical protein
MIARTFTELYLRHFNQLHGALCFCWQTAFCYTTKQLDKNKLKEKIRSFGIYNRENAIKDEESFILKEKPVFKTLTWVNDYTVEENNNNIFCEHLELHEQALKEVEDNLLVLNDKAKQITYANFILRDFDKSFHHIQKLNESEQNNKCKEFFEFVLNRQFISEDETTSAENNSKALPNYNLSIRLINHFDFIDRLIEMFSYSDIDLLELSKKYKHNLYLFDDNKTIKPVDSVFDSSIGSEYLEKGKKSKLQNNILPKFKSPLSDDCLIKIMHYLENKNKLINPNSDIWFFWFDRKNLKNPEFLIWDDSPTLLSNVIQHLCGESIAATVKTAFNTSVYVKPTKNKYERSKMYKEIEQIITISMKKNS